MTVELATIVFIILSMLCLFVAAIFYSLSTYSGEKQSDQSRQFLLLANIFFCIFLYGLLCVKLRDFNEFFIYENGLDGLFCGFMMLFYVQAKYKKLPEPLLFWACPILTVFWGYLFNFSEGGERLLSDTVYLTGFHLLSLCLIVVAIDYIQGGVAPGSHRQLLGIISIYIGMVSNLAPYIEGGSTLFWGVRFIDVALMAYVLFWIVTVNSNLHKESVRFRLAFEQAKVAVVMLDENDNIAYQNGTFLNRYNPFRRPAASDIEFINAALTVVNTKLNHHEGWQGERSFTLDRELITVQIFAHGLYNVHGALLLKVFSILDITEQTQYKKLLQNYSAQLNELSSKLLNIQETERAKIARELHDDIGQQLTLLKFSISSDPTIAGKSQLFESVDTVLQSVRSLSRQLRPAILDELGLPSAIEWFVRQLGGANTNILVSIEEPYLKINHPTDINLFRLVQEIVNNALKHANAQNISILLHSGPQLIRLVITDDGAGFDVNETSESSKLSESFGLLSIQERVDLMKGKVELTSSIGKGTRYLIEASHEQM